MKTDKEGGTLVGGYSNTYQQYHIQDTNSAMNEYILKVGNPTGRVAVRGTPGSGYSHIHQ